MKSIFKNGTLVILLLVAGISTALAGNDNFKNGHPFASLLDLISGNANDIGDNSDAIANLEARIAALEAAPAPAGPATGSVSFGVFVGTSCATITFDSPYASAPRMLASANHINSNHGALFHDPITLWMEEVNTSGFRVCVREVDANNFHDQHVVVDWMAIAR